MYKNLGMAFGASERMQCQYSADQKGANINEE